MNQNECLILLSIIIQEEFIECLVFQTLFLTKPGQVEYHLSFTGEKTGSVNDIIEI